MFALFALCGAPPKKDKKFYINAACPIVGLVVFLPIVPSFKRCTLFSVSSRVFLCFFWHSTVFLLSLYYREFLCTFVFLCFLVKCNTVFDILQQQARETLNSKAKHSTPLLFCKTHKTSALQQNFSQVLKLLTRKTRNMALIVMMLTKTLLPGLGTRKFKPTPSFLRKMFEINSHFHKHFLTILSILR